MYATWTIGKKLSITGAAMLLLTVVLGVLSIFSIRRLDSELRTATEATARRLQLGGEMDTAGSDMLAGMRGIVMFTYAKDRKRAETAKQLFDTAADSWQRAIDELRPLLVTEDGKRLVGQLQAELTEWKGIIGGIKNAADRNQPQLAVQLAVNQGLPIYQANARDAGQFRDLQGRILREQRAKGASIYSNCQAMVFVVIVLSLAVGGLLLYFVRSSNRTLRLTTAELAQASEQVASAANQISSSSNSLAQGASQQAASTEETAASAEEIAVMTRKNAEDAREATNLMAQTSEVVAEANRTLNGMEASMRNINASSEKIAKIIRVIDEIAFQTNILALNAAVEAARAGEAGLGFAVVADEVRNLAQRSAQAAKDTAAMIEESIANSGEGRLKLDQVSQAIKGITERSASAQSLVDQLHASSGEQALGAERIAKAVSQVEQITQATAANAEQTASAGVELNAQSSALRNLVVRLEHLVGAA